MLVLCANFGRDLSEQFCNGIQLNRILPPGPRDYWNELAAEHKNAPEHQKWMYDADPFAARRMVDERQAKAAQRREDAARPESSRSQGSSTTTPSSEFLYAPEVKMATNLRDLVESSVKKVIFSFIRKAFKTILSSLSQAISLQPGAVTANPSVLGVEDVPGVQQQLATLGFSAAQSRNATTALTQPSPLSASLLSTLSPLQACLEYLVLHVPECDLPLRFLPTANSSNPFISSAHSGTEDLKRRWMEEKAVKEGGWPAHVVRECMVELASLDD